MTCLFVRNSCTWFFGKPELVPDCKGVCLVTIYHCCCCLFFGSGEVLQDMLWLDVRYVPGYYRRNWKVRLARPHWATACRPVLGFGVIARVCDALYRNRKWGIGKRWTGQSLEEIGNFQSPEIVLCWLVLELWVWLVWCLFKLQVVAHWECPVGWIQYWQCRSVRGSMHGSRV